MSIPPLLSSPTSSESTRCFRAGTVAQMVGMPVATLHIWEQRYRLTPREALSSGHRLYSTSNVQRIDLLKQLIELGHGIGTVAALGVEQLRQVALTRVSTIAASSKLSVPVHEPTPWRIAVVGVALAHRLQQPSLTRRLGSAPQMRGQFDSLMQPVTAQAGQLVDTLLVHIHGLHDASLAEMQAVAGALGARQLAVFYGFARKSVCSGFSEAGVALLREPRTDAALDDWLCNLRTDATAQGFATAATLLGLASPLGIAAQVVPPRRYSDTTLANFSAQSTTIACECPRHVVDLLMQLSHFETYSAECEQLNPADLVLHAYLRQTTGAARHMFEAALERLASHEGLLLAK